MAQGFRMRKLVDEYKTIFLGKRDKRWNSSKTFSLYLNFLSNGFEAGQKPKLNLLRIEIMGQGFKIRKFIDAYKTIYWESEPNFQTFPKPFPYIWVYYKMLLENVKSLNRILKGWK